MKLYQYDDFKKLNQALGSFKINKVPIVKVEILPVSDKVSYFVLTDPVYKPKPEKPKEKTEKEAFKEAKKTATEVVREVKKIEKKAEKKK